MVCLKQQLNGLRIQKGESLQEHLSIFNELLNQLHIVAAQIEEENTYHIALPSFSPYLCNIVGGSQCISFFPNRQLKNFACDGWKSKGI